METMEMQVSQSQDLGGDVRGAPASPLPRSAADGAGAPAAKRRRCRVSGFWLRQLHGWHWVSAAISLTGMLLFALTGITLNHAGSIAAKPRVVAREATLPRPLLGQLARPHSADAPLPSEVAARVNALVGVAPGRHAAEWSDDEVYVALPGPGSDAWVSIDRHSGAIASETTDRGWISYLNDLHKGRNTGPVWFWFIDAFALACVVFTLTGLLLLQLHARHRPSTWPLVAFGTAIPVAIALLFLH